MYRYKRSISCSYARQGYIYFVSQLYKELPVQDQRRIENLCAKVGGEYRDALFEYVTTDTTATAVCMRHYLSRSTLERVVRKYYKSFPRKL